MAWESVLQGMIGPAYNVILTILLIAVFGGIVFFFVKHTSFTHPAILREIVNNDRTIIHQTKWRFAKNKDGVEGIMFQKPKMFAPISDKHQFAFDPTPLGKKFVEAELYPNGEIEFVSYTAKTRQFQPLTTKQRSILVNQTINAQKRKKKGLFDTIEKLAPMVALTMIVICLMMFYADMAKPLLDMGSTIIQSKETDLLIIQELNNMKNDIQVIKQEILPDVIQGNNTFNKPAPQ